MVGNGYCDWTVQWKTEADFVAYMIQEVTAKTWGQNDQTF